ncbi:MAG: FemAB family PEP-CTERM system-associated protein [Planctomycetota bacterium]|jgi:FemAB-related protein (PEP-CTERM system-associated)
MSGPADETSEGPAADAADAPLEIREAVADDAAAIDAFVLEAEEGTFFHLTGWTRAVVEEFRHRDRSLVARRAGEVVGVLPLTECAGLLGGRALISNAYAVYGGPVAVSADVEVALVRAAEETAVAERVGRLELRCRKDLGLGFDRLDLHATFVRELPRDPEEVLKRMPKKARADARKARKDHGLTLREGRWYVSDLVRLFHENKRGLGSPALPASFFRRLLDVFPEHATVHLTKREGEPLMAVMSFLFRDQVLAYYSGTAENVDRRYKASAFTYMALQEWSVERGYRVFDFGRSRKDSGAFSFKARQGFEAEDLHYQIRLVKDRELPSLNPSNPKTLVLQRTWRSLPAGVARALSTPLSRFLP